MSQDVHDADQIADAKDAKASIAVLVLKLSDVGETLTKLYAQRGDAGADQVRVEKEITRLEEKEITWDALKLEYLRRLRRFEDIQHQQQTFLGWIRDILSKVTPSISALTQPLRRLMNLEGTHRPEHGIRCILVLFTIISSPPPSSRLLFFRFEDLFSSFVFWICFSYCCTILNPFIFSLQTLRFYIRCLVF
jgi:hypothetical protein